jgi:hypothetical protein
MTKYEEFLKEVEIFKKDIKTDFHDWIDSYSGIPTPKHGNQTEVSLASSKAGHIEETLHYYSTWEVLNPFMNLSCYNKEKKEHAKKIKKLFREVLEENIIEALKEY